jgi:hypothetical protein
MAAVGVFGVRRLDHVVLHVRAKPVLRAENGRQPRAGVPGDPVDNMTEMLVH